MNENGSLPLKKEIGQLYTLALIIALLAVIASIAGLVSPNTIYPTAELRESFLANDVTTLFIGLPILLASMWLSRRGKLLGLLLLPGALFFMLYNYLVYLLAMPFNWFYLLYPAIIILSIYGLANLLPKIDAQNLKENLEGRVSERFGGGVLVVLALIFFARAAGILFNAITGKLPVPGTELALNITDALVSPVWVLSGVLLWRRKAFGYLTGLGMLFQGSMLFIALIVLMLIQPLLTDATFSIIAIIVVLLLGMICFVPFALFWRGLQRKN